MKINLHLTPKEAWDFFLLNEDRLSEEMVIIGEGEDSVQICMTEKEGFPLFLVSRGDKIIHKDYAVSERDCNDVLRTIYDMCCPEAPWTDRQEADDEDDFGDETFREAYEDKVYEREDELYLAILDCLGAFLDADDPNDISSTWGVDFVNEVVDDFCTYLRDKHGFSVYRPTIIEEPGDIVHYTDYPYDDESSD